MLIDYSKNNPEYTFDLHSHTCTKADAGLLGTRLVIMSFQQILLFFWCYAALFRTKDQNLLRPCSSFRSGGSRYVVCFSHNAKRDSPTGCVTKTFFKKKKKNKKQILPNWSQAEPWTGQNPPAEPNVLKSNCPRGCILTQTCCQLLIKKKKKFSTSKQSITFDSSHLKSHVD